MDRAAKIEALSAALKNTTEPRLYERYLAVRLCLEGRSLTDIATIIGRTYQTVSAYWKAYQEAGLDGLAIEYSPGKPSKLTEEQQKLLIDTVMSRKPEEAGFKSKSTWTLALISKWIEREFNQSFSIRGVSKLMKRLESNEMKSFK